MFTSTFLKMCTYTTNSLKSKTKRIHKNILDYNMQEFQPNYKLQAENLTATRAVYAAVKTAPWWFYHAVLINTRQANAKSAVMWRWLVGSRDRIQEDAF